MIRVVLADDHTLFREGLTALLQSAPDIQVVGAAPTGSGAIALVKTLRPDVAILDVAMRELNGIDAAARIREKFPATRTLLLSMYASVEFAHRAFAAGARGYVLKEAPAHEVVAAVRMVHGGATYLCSSLRAHIGREAERLGTADSPIDRLSYRERQVLQLVAEGCTNAAIAGRIHVSEKSVETYRRRILQKLRLENTAALIKFAVAHGLTPHL